MPDLRRDAAADRGKLEIARLERDKYGRSAKRTARLIDQLEELESTASEEAIQAEKTTKVTSFERRKPVRKTFPEHLPRERVVIEAHVLGAERLHGDDTTVPLLARGGTKTARLWTCVRDDRPFGGHAPPAVVFYFSRDRGGEHPALHLKGWQGILQADAYAGYNQLYDPTREPGPVTSALCWSHARRKFFELADIEGNPRSADAPRRRSGMASPTFGLPGLQAGTFARANPPRRYRRSPSRR